MKKRMLSILLTLFLALSLLPATALADSNTTDTEVRVSSYAELKSYLDNPPSDVTSLFIEGQHLVEIVDDGEGNYTEVYTPFVWPEGDEEITLDLTRDNTPNTVRVIGGEWVIPGNVTVNCSRSINSGQNIVVNGTWNVKDGYGIVYMPAYDNEDLRFVVNGVMTVPKITSTPVMYGTIHLNGRMELSGSDCYVHNMILGGGAVVADIPVEGITNSIGTLSLKENCTVTCPTGSATIEGCLEADGGTTTAGTCYLNGNISVGRIYLPTNLELVITEGSHITAGELRSYTSSYEPKLTINGTLELDGDAPQSHRFDENVTMNIVEGGILKLNPDNYLDYKESTAAVTGDGTIQLYGVLQETASNGRLYAVNKAKVFGCTGETKIYEEDDGTETESVDWPSQVTDTITIWRNWETDCEHSWGTPTVLAPTCGTAGYTSVICGACQIEKRYDSQPPTGEHTIYFTKSNDSYARVNCSVCGQSDSIYITAKNAVYEEGQAAKTATLNGYGLEWLEEDEIPAIVYANNTAPGTATASATFGGVTISTTFNIVACDHEGGEATCTSGPICSKCEQEYGTALGHTGGTATCKEQATCTRCEQPYGDLADHTYELAHNDTMHWVECSICGLEYLQDYGIEVTSPDQLSKEVLLKWINVYLELQGGATKDQLIYLEKYSDTPSRHASSSTDFAEGDVCLLCGYGKAVCDHGWNGGKVTTAPTCTTKGVRTYTCSICGGTRTEDIPATGHTEVVDAAVAATCTTGGKTAGSHCSVCGTVLTAQEPIGALGHDWDEGVITTPPTLDADGVRTFTCQRCGETRTEAVAKLEKQTILLPGNIKKTYGDDDFYNTASNLTVGGGALTYSSSNTDVAVVDARSGKVTIVGAGDAVITVTAAAVANQYAETSATYAVTVAKAPLTITAKDKAITYGEKAANSGYAVSGFVKGEDESVLSGEAVYSYTYKQYGDVGEYAISVSGLTAQNYEITFVDGKLTVGKATEYTITLSDLEQLTGHVSGVTARIDPYDTSAVLSVEYEVGDSWTATVPQTAGEYSVRAALTASDNIVVPASAAYTTATLTVKPGVTVDTGNGPADVDVAVDVSGGTAEITVTEDDLTQIAENADGQVSIDLGSVSDVDTLVLPGNLVEELSKSDKAESLTVSTENASVTLSADVLDTVASAVTGGEDTVSVRLESVAMDELNKAQQDALDAITTDYPVAVVDVSLVVTHADGTTDTLHELGGDVTVTVPYEQLPGLLDGQYVVACYISDDGTVTYLFAQADEANRTITFTTNHFSNYAVFVSGKPTSAVTVDSGSGSGIYLAGDTVTVKADSKSGYTFAGWEVVSGDVTLTDSKAAETTFTMPAANVELKATYTKNRSGGGGGVSAYTLTFDTNGGSKIDSVSKTGGITIDLTGYVPTRAGYDFDGWYSDAKLTDKVTAVKLTEDMTVYAKWTEKNGENPFTDVADDAYYADAVIWAVSKSITSGTTATTFSPDTPCTRAQAVTFLWRAAGSPVVNYAMSFSDVSADAYYAEAVRWAVSQGITKGTSDTTFSPDATCTRAQIVTFLWRSQKSPAADGVNPFTDVAADAYYANAVAWAAENGITGGTTASTFSPDNDCTRAQIVTFLFRSAK